MKYVQLPLEENKPQLFGRIDDDGLMRVTCIEEDRDLQDWIAEGNTPEPYETQSEPDSPTT